MSACSDPHTLSVHNTTDGTLTIAWLDAAPVTDSTIWISVPPGATSDHAVDVTVLHEPGEAAPAQGVDPAPLEMLEVAAAAGSYVAVTQEEPPTGGGATGWTPEQYNVFYVGHQVNVDTCAAGAGGHTTTTGGPKGVGGITATSAAVEGGSTSTLTIAPHQEVTETTWTVTLAALGCVVLGAAIYAGVRCSRS